MIVNVYCLRVGRAVDLGAALRAAASDQRRAPSPDLDKRPLMTSKRVAAMDRDERIQGLATAALFQLVILHSSQAFHDMLHVHPVSCIFTSAKRKLTQMISHAFFLFLAPLELGLRTASMRCLRCR